MLSLDGEECAVRQCRLHHHTRTEMHGHHQNGNTHHSHHTCNHGHQRFQPHHQQTLSSQLCTHGAVDHTNTPITNPSPCACCTGALNYDFQSNGISPADRTAAAVGSCGVEAVSPQPQNNNMGMGGPRHLQQHRCHHHHHLAKYTEQEATASPQAIDGAVSHLLENQREAEPVEYEYYVWDPAAQEYVQTDQETGEKMLQDPQYFQYHYRLVEDPQNGEADLVPEPVDEHGHPQCREVASLKNSRFAGAASQQRYDHFEEDLPGDLLDAPEALVTPRQTRCCRSPLASRSGCVHAAQTNVGYNFDVLGKENTVPCSAFDFYNQAHYYEASNRDVGSCAADGEAARHRSQKVLRGKNAGPKSDILNALTSHARSFMSCSRPWESGSVTLRARELQIRQLRHLQRVQELEKEELMRRQMLLDEMAASLPKSTQQLFTSDASRSQNRLVGNPRTPTKKAGRPSPVISCLLEGDRKARCDPVNRGRYFRAKWKSDRFLEQQRHPPFDVKAYDAWLKNSGHLLRGRALELQQEEHRLLSQLQQERNTQSNRYGHWM